MNAKWLQTLFNSSVKLCTLQYALDLKANVKFAISDKITLMPFGVFSHWALENKFCNRNTVLKTGMKFKKHGYLQCTIYWKNGGASLK